MLEDRRMWIILGALALSLLLNAAALMRIGDLREEVEQVRSQTIHVSNLQSEVMSINTRIDQLIEDQAWVSEVDWTIEPEDGADSCEDDVPVVGTISFREIGRDADVSVEFRETSSGDWQRAGASAVNDVDYRVSTDLSSDSNWEYRVLADTGEARQTSDPEPLNALHQLTDHAVFFEQGESRQQDNDRWVRFVVDNHSQHVSPCNEIVAATIELVDGDDVVESVSLQSEYPGDYDPEGYDEPDKTDGMEEAEERIVGAYPEGSDERTVWWTDWLEMDGSVSPVVSVEFGDGTTRTVDRMGAH